MLMREVSRQISIRMPARVDALLDDLVQEGIFRNRTEAIVEGIIRLYEDLTVSESEMNLRLKLVKGDYNNLRRLKQLDGGSEEMWAERLINLYAMHHAKILAEQVEDWDAVFQEKRRLEENTESLAEIRKR
jgi:Arc/MetJ-type ribon-helix-helix transcriptional regulator